MRKLVLLMAVVLVIVAAAPALAKRVVNESHKEYQIQAWMGTDDGSENGGAWAIQGSNGEALGIDYNIGYECEAENDDLAFESVNGEAHLEEFTVEPTKGKTKFTTGTATGSFMDGSSYYWQECDGDDGSIDLGPSGPAGPVGERLTILMDGTDGSLVKTSGSNSWHIPSESNNHRSDKGLMRQAVGQVIIPGALDWAGDGSIGRHSWSEHTNE